MRIAFRCLFRVLVGTLLGLAPAALYYLYGALVSDEKWSGLEKITDILALIGGLLGFIWGLAWALTLLEKHLSGEKS